MSVVSCALRRSKHGRREAWRTMQWDTSRQASRHKLGSTVDYATPVATWPRQVRLQRALPLTTSHACHITAGRLVAVTCQPSAPGLSRHGTDPGRGCQPANT